MDNKSPFENFDGLQLNSEAKSFLSETAKWAHLLARLGLAILGLMFLAVLVMLVFGAATTVFSNRFGMGVMGLGMIIVYVLIGLLYFLPLYYLFKFANYIKSALTTNDNQQLTEGFRYLKSHYKFIGIFALISIAFYVLIFLFGIFGRNINSFL